jgi:hypothetical protein
METKRKSRKGSFLCLPDSLIQEICQFLPFSQTGTHLQRINKSLRHLLKTEGNWNFDIWNWRLTWYVQKSQLPSLFPNLKIRKYQVVYPQRIQKTQNMIKVKNIQEIHLHLDPEYEEDLKDCLILLENSDNLRKVDLYTYTLLAPFQETWCTTLIEILSKKLPKLENISLRTGSLEFLYRMSLLPLKNLHWNFGAFGRLQNTTLELISQIIFRIPGLLSLTLVNASGKQETETEQPIMEMKTPQIQIQKQKQKPSKGCLEKLTIQMFNVSLNHISDLFYLGNIQYLTLNNFLTESDLVRIRTDIPLLKTLILYNLPSVEVICLDGLQFLEKLKLNFQFDITRQKKKIKSFFQFGKIPLKFLVLPEITGFQKDEKEEEVKLRLNEAMTELTKTYQLKSLSTVDTALHQISCSDLDKLQTLEIHLSELEEKLEFIIQFILGLPSLQYLTLSGNCKTETIECILRRKNRSLKCLQISTLSLDPNQLNLWRSKNPKICILLKENK